jgi:hypothetical protein
VSWPMTMVIETKLGGSAYLLARAAGTSAFLCGLRLLREDLGP